jgi:hypothetical protein
MSSIFKPGRVIAETGTNSIWSKLVRWSTKSKWTHVSMVLDEDHLIESIFPHGVRIVKVSDRLKELEDREWAVLELWATPEAGVEVAEASKKYLGRRYDFLQCAILGLFGRFIQDGPLRVVCSRLITSAHWDCNVMVFNGQRPKSVSPRRWAGMLKGYCTPGDLVAHSMFKVIAHRFKR